MTGLMWVLVGVGVALVAVLAVVLPRLHKQSAYESIELDELPEDLKKRLPVSLHPVIDLNVCMGSGACVAACPEGKILRLHDGHSHLVHPEACIGHGACARECPVGAITLVFGTAERGVDIPHVSPSFETNVKGVFIAGELGGMGLIRNAVAQGVQAMQTIAKRGGSKSADVLDVVVVGAGPAGLAAGLIAHERGLRYAIIDQETALGGTIAHYPRNKLIMTGPFDLPGWGRIKKRELTKEELMAIWTDVIDKVGLDVRLGERLDAIDKDGDVCVVRTSVATLRARNVLLAIGRRGTPRALGIPGEELTKVAYSLREPDAYAGERVLVIGGGDSAIEAALSLSEVSGTTVTMSYRGDTLFRAKPKNQERLQEAVEAGRVNVLLGSNATRIAADHVVISHAGGTVNLANDQVFIFAGGVLPTGLLSAAGIAMERKFGTR
ncbi:MAG: 4Fe-4S ferredoxin [Deltaproteobacteria bacterium HGW-Deltaproteobacteria-14]|jgi:thioredoxin reductase/NAD-dependent dihydropyrimidine dehydrogenase PreA subunit|nr:MAG: 4Fe-4S ferredoxin [Deltaproteobacteria bacterium HGW-Deltaproteobacteria-14]